MAKLTEVLKNRDFFLLWLGQIISQFGDRLNQMALIALIYARAPGSTFQLAKILSFTIIPVFLVGPVAASYIDRWNHRRTMVACDFFRAALVLLVALFFVRFANLWPVYIIIFLIFSVSRFFIPAKMAIIPDIVSSDKLLLANSLSSTTGMIAAVAGFGLGGLIVEHVGSSGGFLIDAVSYLVSGFFILTIATKATSYFKKEDITSVIKNVQRFWRKTLFTEMREGWQYFFHAQGVRFVAQMFFLLWSAVGAVYVVIIVFVQHTLGSVTKDLGFLAMFLGLGLFSGSLIYGRFGEKFSKMKVIFVSLGTSGIVLSIFTVFLKIFSSALFTLSLSFILGTVISPIMISSQTLIHEVTEEKMRGRVFGFLEIIGHLAFLLFMFISSFLAEKIDRFWILLSVGIIMAVVGWGAIMFKVDRKGFQYGRI